MGYIFIKQDGTWKNINNLFRNSNYLVSFKANIFDFDSSVNSLLKTAVSGNYFYFTDKTPLKKINLPIFYGSNKKQVKVIDPNYVYYPIKQEESTTFNLDNFSRFGTSGNITLPYNKNRFIALLVGGGGRWR